MAPLRLTRTSSITPVPDGILLRSDLGTFRLDGDDVSVFVDKLLPLLDGTREADDLAEAMAGYSKESVVALLKLLIEKGLVEEGGTGPPAEERWQGESSFFGSWLAQPEKAMARLRGARVLVMGLEPWGVVAAEELAGSGVGRVHLLDDETVGASDLLFVRSWTERELGRARVEAAKRSLAASAPWCDVTTSQHSVGEDGLLQLDGKWDLALATVSADDLNLLMALAKFAHRNRIRSVTAHLSGLDAVMGPAVVPGETACWNCARLRILANLPDPVTAREIQASLIAGDTTSRTRTYPAPAAGLLGHLVALEAVKLLTEYTDSRLVGRILVQNLVSLETSYHKVVHLPWCEVCGEPPDGGGPDGSRSGGPGGKGFASQPPVGGGDHPAGSTSLLSDDPSTLRRELEGLVDPKTGVVGALHINYPDATEPELPYTASAFVGRHEYRGRMGHSEIGSGKGLTRGSALIGAVGEAVERYSASIWSPESFIRCSYSELPDDGFDPFSLCLYEPEQYEAEGFPYSPYDHDLTIDWMRGRRIATSTPVWLPALPVFFNFHVPPDENFCQVTSNGLAAGADLEDATMRAVLELVERDAFMLSWLAQLPGRRLAMDSSIPVEVHEAKRQLNERAGQVELVLLNAGVDIPVVACVALGDGITWPAVTLALASHPRVRIAAQKAILELGHVGPYIRRLMLKGDPPVPKQPADVLTLVDHALYYVPLERATAVDFLIPQSAEPVKISDFRDPEEVSLRWCVDRLRQAGIDVVAADVTSADLRRQGPFKVARALGTNLQPIHFGAGLERRTNPRLEELAAAGINVNPHPLA